MAKPWDIAVVGSCMIDLVCYAPRLPKSGETLRGSNFVNGFGGKGCNQCVAATKLGANCLMVARIGDDFFGKNYLGKLVEYGISTTFVKSTQEISTGMAQITVAENGSSIRDSCRFQPGDYQRGFKASEQCENHIVVVFGANEKLTETDLKDAAQEIENCKVLVCQLEIPQSTTIEALRIKANSNTGISILNAAPAHEELDPLLFSLPDIFCVNETEAEAMTGAKVEGAKNAEEAIRKLISKGCKQVIVTLGSEGAVHGKAGSEVFTHVPAFPVNAVDTTGAGDAFVGALAVFLASKPDLPMKELLKRANNVAAISVQRLGTQESFPLLSELPEQYF